MLGAQGEDVDTSTAGEIVPFTAQTRMSGVDFAGTSIRKGAGSRISALAQERGGRIPPELALITDEVSRGGATPLTVIENDRLLGVVALSDISAHETELV